MDRIEVMSYHLELPDSLADDHSVFHVSMLRKHLRDEEQQLLAQRPLALVLMITNHM